MKTKKDDFAYFQLVYPKIIETIRLVAAPPETQISAFPENVFPPDEIADTIEHAIMMSRALLGKKYITQKQFDSIESIDHKFNSFSKENWTIEAIQQADIWKETRELAKKALSEFSVSYATPNLYWFATL